MEGNGTEGGIQRQSSSPLLVPPSSEDSMRAVLAVFLEDGGWKSEPWLPEGITELELPARRTRQLHMPITVSLMGSWST